MPTHKLAERDPEWVHAAPVVARSTFPVAAPQEQVFESLASIGDWATWHRGIRKVRIDGAASGVGATRTVWVGPGRFHERFIGWSPGQELIFTIYETNLPGLVAMSESWAVGADPADSSRSILTVTMGAELAGAMRPLANVVRAGLMRGMKGTAGISSQFS